MFQWILELRLVFSRVKGLKFVIAHMTSPDTCSPKYLWNRPLIMAWGIVKPTDQSWWCVMFMFKFFIFNVCFTITQRSRSRPTPCSVVQQIQSSAMMGNRRLVVRTYPPCWVFKAQSVIGYRLMLYHTNIRLWSRLSQSLPVDVAPSNGDYTTKENSVSNHGGRTPSMLKPGPNFIELLSTKICLAWNFFLDKNRITNQISICCILLVTGIQLLFAYPENHVEIWLVILFLSRKKFHAKQIFVLSSSMKLGPGLYMYTSWV